MDGPGFFRVALPVQEPAERRPLRDWLILAARPLWPLVRRVPTLLRPGSAARTRWMQRTLPGALAAFNRGDLAIADPYYREDVELRADPHTLMPLGLEPVYRGREGIRAMTRDWSQAFTHWRWDVSLLVDGEDRWIGLGEMVTVGASSEIEVRRRIAAATEMSGGRVARQDLFWEWEDALAHFDLPALDEIPWAAGPAKPRGTPRTPHASRRTPRRARRGP